MKKFYGRSAYVQSAGVKNDMEIDGFAVAVCHEINVELSAHRSRSFEEMKEWGGFWKSRHTPSMYRAALFGAHCAGLKSCTGNP